MKTEIRDVFIQTLSALRESNELLTVLVSDSSSTCRIKPFMEKYPDSVVNVGIAEQNLVGMAAGMSLGGMIPFTANAAPFLMGRSNEQVKTDICYSNTNVKLVGLNPGFAYGSLGPTHHCLDDLSTALSFGNIEVLVPSDPEETAQMTEYAFRKEGPVYIRLDSFKAESIHPDDYIFQVGEPVQLTEGTDLTIVTTGTIVHEALEAEKELKAKGFSVQLITLPSLRPLNRKALTSLLQNTGKLLSVEEHSVHGGLGALLADLILESGLNMRFRKLGVPEGEFAPASPREDIKAGYKLNAPGIIEESIRLIKG
ncbi:MAG: transketolase C-terminal domain-containing protein [Spirochaetales bacterium]|nr:transketolase C-terminal domain-containing protein [Spirochaetales bacterium]